MGGIAAVGRWVVHLVETFKCSSLSSYSTYNYAGRLNNRLFSAFKTNNMDGARLEMRRSQASIKLLSKYGEPETDTIIILWINLITPYYNRAMNFVCSNLSGAI